MGSNNAEDILYTGCVDVDRLKNDLRRLETDYIRDHTHNNPLTLSNQTFFEPIIPGGGGLRGTLIRYLLSETILKF